MTEEICEAVFKLTGEKFLRVNCFNLNIGMKIFSLFLILFCVATFSFSQETIKPTDEIKIFGLVEKQVTIKFSDIAKENTVALENFKVTNHLGEFRKEIKNIKGVPLLPILQRVNITSPSPKVLSEYYLVFRCSDGYSVVYSWNEIFNTEIGKSIFVITEADNKKLAESSDRILVISIMDFKTGRRHLKGLESIEVKRI